MTADDPYALYVVAAWGATAAILAWLVWTTLRANARTRDELDAAEKERRR